MFQAKRKTDISSNSVEANQATLANINSKLTEATNKLVTDEAAFVFYIDGGGSAITTGVKCFQTVPFNCAITEYTLLADQSGSIVIDIWVDTFTNFPPTDADTITGADEPELSLAQSKRSAASDIKKWKLNLAKGGVIGINVDSCTTITWCTLTIKVKKAAT